MEIVWNAEASEVLVATGYDVNSSLPSNLLAAYGICIGDFILAGFGLFHIFFAFFCIASTFVVNMHPFFKKVFLSEGGRQREKLL